MLATPLCLLTDHDALSQVLIAEHVSLLSVAVLIWVN